MKIRHDERAACTKKRGHLYNLPDYGVRFASVDRVYRWALIRHSQPGVYRLVARSATRDGILKAHRAAVWPGLASPLIFRVQCAHCAAGREER